MNTRRNRESSAQHEPRTLGEILHNYLMNSNELLAVAYRKHKVKAEGEADLVFKDFFPDTHLAVDLKLLARKPGRMNVGAYLEGTLVHDADDHFTFVQKFVEKMVKKVQRNPVIFAGGCVNVHLLADGTKRPAFNHPRFYPGYTFSDFCVAAAQELLTVARLLGEENSQE